MHDPRKNPEENDEGDLVFIAYLLFEEKPLELKHLPLDKAFDFKMRGMDLEFEENKLEKNFEGFFTYSCHMLVHYEEPFCPWSDGAEVVKAWVEATGADYGLFGLDGALIEFAYGFRREWIAEYAEMCKPDEFCLISEGALERILEKLNRKNYIDNSEIDLETLMKM